MRSLTLVLNPNARKPRLQPPSLEKMKESLGPKAQIHVTKNLVELDALMSGWAGKGGYDSEETLCFYGGDGSVARGLSALIRHHGENSKIPPILAVRAGTFNMLCTILGFREVADKTFLRWKRNEFQNLMNIPTIKVEVEGREPQYGFVFAWGLGYRVLREYYSRRAMPNFFDAVVVAAKSIVGGLHPDVERQALYKSEHIELEIEGKLAATEPLRSLVCGTITRLSLGLKPFAPVPVTPNAFHISANGMLLPRIVWHSPTLLFGMGDQRELNLGESLVSRARATHLKCRISEGFTMDGEVFELPQATQVTITPGPVIPFWTL